jgi:hypothetical protein
VQNKKAKSLLDDDDDVVQQPQPTHQNFNPVVQPQVATSKNDPFDILGLDIGGPSIPPPKTNNFSNDLMGGFSLDPHPQNTNLFNPTPAVTQPVVNQNKGFDSLLDDGFLGGASQQPKPPVQTFVQNTQQAPQSFGFDFLGTGTTTTTTPVVSQPTQFFNQQSSTVPAQDSNYFKFKAYETPHIEIWMECRK